MLATSRCSLRPTRRLLNQVPVPVPVPGSSSVRAVVSRADLIYNSPVARSEEGIPIGNGRMGTLVWTTPSALKFQINRVDIQPINKDTRSFSSATPITWGAPGSSISSSPALAPTCSPQRHHQRLSVYEGLLDVKAAGVNARMLAWHERDVIAIEVDDRRAVPEPIQINLRMLRSASQYFGGAMEKMIADRIVTVRTREHTARVADLRARRPHPAHPGLSRKARIARNRRWRSRCSGAGR